MYKLQNVLFTLCLAISNAAALGAESGSPESIITDELVWISPPAVTGLQYTWIHGNETDTGLYVIRVRLDSGARIPPHSHPDKRLSTVLSGTLYVGFAEVFDQNKLIAVKAGDAYVAPAKIPHYIWAKDGPTEYQESGWGPTATIMIKR